MVSAKDWLKLIEAMTQSAEGFAMTDPVNGYLYRQEASEFRELNTPADADELAVRAAYAATVRQRWAERLRGAAEAAEGRREA